MKKALVLFFVGFVFFGVCSAEKVSAQSTNDVQRIVGTWTGGTLTFTFNANGTFRVSNSDDSDDNREGNYMVSNFKLIFRSTGSLTSNTPTDYYLSADGKTLVFSYSLYYGRSNTSTYFIWLNKQ